jgi:hypothetical protein
VPKDKKKKKDKKGGKSKGGAGKAVKVGTRLRELTQNPLVADLVAATLVAAAAALKDTKKAHELAATAEKDLEQLGRKGARSGNALWQLALEVGQKSLDALSGDGAAPPTRPKAKARPKAASARSGKSSAAAKPAKSKASGRKSPRK